MVAGMHQHPLTPVTGQAARHVEAVAARTSLRLGEVSRAIHQVILRDIAELAADPDLVDILRESVSANVDAVVNTLRYGIDPAHFEVPAVATEYARRLAQRGLPVEALVRAYRLGQTDFLRIVFDDMITSGLDSTTSLLVAQQIMARTAEYIDWVTERVIGAYTAEREHWLTQRSVLRTRHIRRLLSGRYPDTEASDELLESPIRLRHIALVAWAPDLRPNGEGYAQIELELRRIRDQLPLSGDSLVVPADQSTIWAWLPLFAHTTDADVLAAVNELVAQSNRDFRYAIGSVESGGRGFRISHRRALAVRNVMVAGKAGTRVGAFSEPTMRVVTLTGSDLTMSRDWVASVLGPLVAGDPDTARLRETLEAYLNSGSSYSVTAEKLHVHPNTIKYRIHKAEKILQDSTNHGRIDVAVALALCSQLGEAMLDVRAG